MKYEIEIELGGARLRQAIEADERELLRRIRALEKRYPQATITWREVLNSAALLQGGEVE